MEFLVLAMGIGLEFRHGIRMFWDWRLAWVPHLLCLFSLTYQHHLMHVYLAIVYLPKMPMHYTNF
jgi:hypothetical protein